MKDGKSVRNLNEYTDFVVEFIVVFRYCILIGIQYAYSFLYNVLCIYTMFFLFCNVEYICISFLKNRKIYLIMQ